MIASLWRITAFALSLLILSDARLIAQPAATFDGQIEEGRKALSQQRHDSAIACFERAVRLRETSALAHQLLASALLQSIAEGFTYDKQPLERAKNEEQIALKLTPDDPDALTGLAEATYRLGLGSFPSMFNDSTSLAPAIELLKTALRTHPDAFSANFYLAHLESKQIGTALIRAVTALPATGPRGSRTMSPDIKSALWEKYSPAFQEAIGHATKALAAKPDSFAAMGDLAGLFSMRSQIQQKNEEVKADRAQSESWTAKRQLAYARAQREASHPVTASPKFASFGAAMAAGRKSSAGFDYESAATAFSSAVSFNEKSADAHVALADALIVSASGNAGSAYPFDPERLQRAIQEDQRALALAPQNAEAMAGIADATYALAATSGEKRATLVASSKTWAEKSLAAEPNNYHANYLLAYLASQEFGRAEFAAHEAAYRTGSRDGALSAESQTALKNQYGALVDEGFRSAQTALKTDPNAYLAMYELSSLYNARHALSAVPEAADLEQARQWRAKAVHLAPKDDGRGDTIRAAEQGGIIGGILGAIPSSPPPTSVRH